MTYFCCDQRRREEVRLAAAASDDASNGIDFVEVVDAAAPVPAPGEKSWRQRILRVHFIHDGHVAALEPANFRIDGGERTRDVRVEAAQVQATDPPQVRELRLNKAGDFSVYRLRLVADKTRDEPPADFDPILSRVEFSFKVECPTPFDCESPAACPAEPLVEPEIDYLSRDYASYRRLMLDRLAVLLPQWRDRAPADVAVTLVEALAYVGDHLSYQQDAIATEAYLVTARRRASVRRHARLVDYAMHDGCNARAWIQVRVSAERVLLDARTRLFAGLNHLPARVDIAAAPDAHQLNDAAVVFETAHDAALFQAHDEMRFYTWGDRRCCLPKGAMRATLVDGEKPADRLRLCPGDILIFKEKLGPQTGAEGDADAMRGHAVRLTRVHPAAERVIQRGRETNRIPLQALKDPLTEESIVEIEWDERDALPFALCLSGTTQSPGGERLRDDLSVALGNIVLVDHGLTLEPESLGTVPASTLYRAIGHTHFCGKTERLPVAPRFNPSLTRGPLTHAIPYDSSAPASSVLAGHASTALPAVELSGDDDEDLRWSARRDLLDSHADDRHFVVELDNDGTARLRFGNGRHGKRPPEGKSFTVVYRIGSGVVGNVGADTITHIVHDADAISAVTNPMAACGGTEPESLEDVRQRAPSAFRRQERAVTETDYATLSAQEPGVQRAAATFRWTGSWHTAFVTVDRRGGTAVDEAFELSLRRRLERFRLIGHDLEVDGPRFVPLEIEMQVCVKPDYFRNQVRAALLELFGSRMLADGRRGLFHPDNFTFGQTVYLSPLYAAAQSVEGVASVHVTAFRRLGILDPQPLLDGKLVLGRLEIARLDSDPNFPERGVFRLDMGGGK